jgi:hypothetical protein
MSRSRRRFTLGQLLVTAAVYFCTPSLAHADTTFSYQGLLLSGGEPVQGTADLRFRLYDAEVEGNQIGATVTRTNVGIESGGFTVELDFGSVALTEDERWLEIDVRLPAGAGEFVTLAPRQAMTNTPRSVQTRGFFVDEAHDVGLGTTAPRTRFDVVSTAEGATAETVAQMGVSDAPGDFLRIGNATDIDGSFVPGEWGHHQTDERDAFTVRGSTTLGQDTGSRAVMTFDTWRSDGVTFTGPIVNRPLFDWSNGGTSLMTMDASGRLGLGTTEPAAPLHILGTNPTLRLQDSDSTGSAQVGWISLRDSAGTETGWFGFGSANDTDLTVRNNLGDIVFAPEGSVAIASSVMIEHSGDEASLLWFAMDRPWEFRQEGSGSSASLKLQSVGFSGDRNLVLPQSGSTGTWMSYRNLLGDDLAMFEFEDCPNAPCARLLASSDLRSVRLETNPGTESYEPHTGLISVGRTGVPGEMWVPNSGTGQIDVFRTNAKQKNFRIPSPSEAGMDIVFTCVEGPELAAYVRGTAYLENGRAVVELPQHFADVTVADGMTVELTPASAASKGLAVVARSVERFEVRELFDGHGTYDFDWKVTAVRQGHENFEVIRPRGKP